jgi:hypothetical protein
VNFWFAHIFPAFLDVTNNFLQAKGCGRSLKKLPSLRQRWGALTFRVLNSSDGLFAEKLRIESRYEPIPNLPWHLQSSNPALLEGWNICRCQSMEKGSILLTHIDSHRWITKDNKLSGLIGTIWYPYRYPSTGQCRRHLQWPQNQPRPEGILMHRTRVNRAFEKVERFWMVWECLGWRTLGWLGLNQFRVTGLRCGRMRPKFPKQFNLDKVDKAWGNHSRHV